MYDSKTGTAHGSLNAFFTIKRVLDPGAFKQSGSVWRVFVPVDRFVLEMPLRCITSRDRLLCARTTSPHKSGVLAEISILF